MPVIYKTVVTTESLVGLLILTRSHNLAVCLRIGASARRELKGTCLREGGTGGFTKRALPPVARHLFRRA